MKKFFAIAAVLLFVLSGTAFAAYPTKPVTMIVAYAAGGSTDILARITAKYLEAELKQPFVVVNKPGAAGSVGFTSIAKAAPDGYSIGLINLSGVIVNPIVQPDVVRYRITDFAGIANVVTDPGVFCVKADSPLKNLDDLIAAAKAAPGKLAVSHEGAGSGDHLGVMEFCKKASIEMNPVPFEGDAPAKAALLGGHIDVLAVNVSEIAEMVNTGQLRALAVQNDKRSAELPDVPTFAELGYPTVIQGTASRGFAAPKDIPAEALDVLVSAMKKIVASNEYQEELKKLNMPIDFVPGEEFTKLLLDQHKLWSDLWETDPWLKK
ncbi:MAG: tripartite tricarboxylate transporter substrate binding protein [Aminobacteriaceae bacterium]|uniref:Bug family tripartite tricarboxylate transporter substrate binding protein n=1 Tax=Aminivibrio sp. TaxID=1872489 RepID=UPI00345E7443|nr:tripartite tricarboxylate transporter substrate binding protein [Synergistaceae bacterium]MDD4612108.1 tripartite tricarboxylate transporter substrate binding protein [Synergistaceae bacterium]